jgi:hypothetical protein
MRPIALALLFAACGSEPRPAAVPDAATAHDTVPAEATPSPTEDTVQYPDHAAGLPTIGTDGFPITPRMLSEARYDPVAPYDFDGRWFHATGTDQVLAIEEHTDHHHLKVFLFHKGKAPAALVAELPFQVPTGERMPADSLRRNWDRLFRPVNELNSAQLTSRKGFTFGTPERALVDAYGAPDSLWKDGPYTVRDWHFVGDGAYDGRVELKGRPLAEGSFGHDVRLWTRSGKLVAYRLHNAIP